MKSLIIVSRAWTQANAQSQPAATPDLRVECSLKTDSGNPKENGVCTWACPTQLTGLRPCVATHFFGGVCVPCVVALHLKGVYITLVSHAVTGWAVIPWGKIRKRGGPRSKLDWKPLLFYKDFFLMRKKYYTYTVLALLIRLNRFVIWEKIAIDLIDFLWFFSRKSN